MRRGGARKLAGSGPCLALLFATSFLACSLLDNLDDLSALPAGEAAHGGASGSSTADSDLGVGAGNAEGTGAAPAGAAGASAGDTSAGSSGAAGSAAAGASGSTGSSDAGTGTGGDAGAGGADAGSLGATQIFWLERGSKTVHVANSDGTQNQPIYTVMGGAGSGLTGIAIDTVGARVYFADESRQRIQSANFDGAAVLTPLSGLGGPAGIDLDIGAGKLYFSERGATPRIQRANLNGTASEPLITAVSTPCGLAVDPGAGKLYFVDDSLDAIFSAALDGSNLTNLNIGDVANPVEISIDTLDGKLYWTESAVGGPKVRRANRDGSAVEDIITPLTLPGFSTAAGLEVDVAGRVLYFVDGGANGSILRARLDGTGTVPVIGGLNDPTSLTLTGP